MTTRAHRAREITFNYNPEATRFFLGDLRTACRNLVPHTNYNTLTCVFYTPHHNVFVEIDQVMRTSTIIIHELKNKFPHQWVFVLGDLGFNLDFILDFTEETQGIVSRIPAGQYAFQQPGVRWDMVRDSMRIQDPALLVQQRDILLAKIEDAFGPSSGVPGSQVMAQCVISMTGHPELHSPPIPLILPASTW